MAVAVALAIAHSRLQIRPGKNEVGVFDAHFHLDNEAVAPKGLLTGKLIINNPKELVFYGLRIQLDAIANLMFSTKVDNMTSNHKKIVGMFQDSADLSNGYYMLSPYRTNVNDIGENDDGGDSCPVTHEMRLEKGSHTIHFSLRMPNETLPAPFRSKYGNLQYKVTAYIRLTHYYVEVADKAIQFKGLRDLNKFPSLNVPVKHESGLQKSIFSSKKVISSVLALEKKGYLPREDIRFQLSVTNSKCYMIRQVGVYFVRRIIYNINGACKSTTQTLDTYENNEIHTDEVIDFEGKFTVPRGCIPSYCEKSVYNVEHYVKYNIKVANNPGPIRGQIEIVIGTCRTNCAKASPLAQSDSDWDGSNSNDYETFCQRQRSDSIISRLSDCSLMTVVSLPPSYSQLPSRAQSAFSLETLPPHYDDI